MSLIADLPPVIQDLAVWAFSMQRQLNGEIRQSLALVKSQGGWQPIWAIIGASFLYGVLHAIGPGHGKLAIGTLLVSRRIALRQGLLACAVSAMVQATSAIGLVLVLSGLLSLAPRHIMAHAEWLELASYALIAAMGLYLLVQALRGRDGCGHHHQHHDHGPCCHGHHHAAPSGMTLFGMAAAIGFRPCSGAILVLLFTLANGFIWVGIAATFAMGIGVGLTVSGIGLSALGVNRWLDGRFSSPTLRRGLSILGALVITVFGIVMMLGGLRPLGE